jgi:hypothetical protein
MCINWLLKHCEPQGAYKNRQQGKRKKKPMQTHAHTHHYLYTTKTFWPPRCLPPHHHSVPPTHTITHMANYMLQDKA